MIRWLNLKIKTKLLLFFMIIGIIPLAIVTFAISLNLKKELTKNAFDKLETIQIERLAYIEKMLSDTIKNTSVLVKNQDVINAYKDFDAYAKKNRGNSYGRVLTHTQDYHAIATKYDHYLRKLMISLSASDLMLISYKTGQVVYSVEKKGDLGTDLKNGYLKLSGLGNLWLKIRENKNNNFIDFSKYSPANNSHCAFFGHPIIDEKGKPYAILAIQIKASALNKIVQSRQNMGKTGESYLIAYLESQDVFEIRSNLKTMGDGRYIVGYRHPTNLDYWVDAKAKGKKGGFGIYKDSYNQDVLVSYNQVTFNGLNWYLISKIDKKEIFIPIKKPFYFTMAILTIMITATFIGSIFFAKTISRPLTKLMGLADAISKGDLNVKLRVRRRDELGKLSLSLNNMAKNLALDRWMKSGKETLDDVMRGEQNINDLASKFISTFTIHLGGSLGAVYHCYDRHNLKLIASYSFCDRENNFNNIEIGEGLVGQAAFEQKTIYFTDLKKDVPLLNTGIEERKPTAIMVAPLVFEGELIGAFLVGAMEPFTKKQKEFTNMCLDNISILFKAALSRQTIDKLLDSSKKQQDELKTANEELEEQTKALKKSEAELQAQQEELRVTNEELEEQTKALKKSESELQAQQEELRVTNEELEERTKAIEVQSKAIQEKNISLNKIKKDVEKKAKELEISNKYKSQFLANMSHELRTPLNSILILAKIFKKNRDENLTPKQIESASAIYSSGSDLLRIINEILDLSKVEAGKLDLYFENMPISMLCKDLDRLFSNQAKDKEIDYKIEKDDDIPKEIHTDSNRLQQILRNLLSNAFKFSENGEVKLLIKRPEPKDVENTSLDINKSTAFYVIDNGIGIPKEKQKSIFGAFQQVDGSTSRDYGGTGLGLSISRALTKALGGVISLESEEKKGSRFSVILPDFYSPKNLETQTDFDKEDTKQQEPVIKEPSREESIAETVIEPEPKVSKIEFKDDRDSILKGEKTILLIEDDEVFLGVLADIARESGFKCIVANTGEKGLLYAEQYRPSAIILDVGLPGINGWTVMERLKSNRSLRHIPVHFISGDDCVIDAMKMGAIGYLVKPVTTETMTKTFDKIETTISSKIKNLLVVEDDELQQKTITQLIGNTDVKITMASTGEKAYNQLCDNNYDCVVLDLGLSDMSGFRLLGKIKENPKIKKVPIIIYTGRDLTRDEENELNKYAESIIIKGVKSPERLLDETALFLHRVESSLPLDKQEVLNMVHNKEEVLRDKHILLVDDDMRNVFALSSVLEDNFMKVSIARDGLESIKQLDEKPDIDLVLMDIMMPKMDGYEAMKKIRAKNKFSKLPIIALTAKAMKGDRAKCIESGASDYLAKPVNVEKLISMLRVWLYR